MSLRQLPALLLAIVGLVLLIVIVLSSGSGYKLTVQLANADGLEAGSQVKIGGVPVGSVTHLGLGRGDVVDADVRLDSGHTITRNASAQIVPDDLLGSMYLQLTPGKGPSLPSPATIASGRVSYPVQLDQVLDVLDADTRAKLGILIDQAGIALSGRAADFNRLLALLPSTFGSGQQLLTQLNSDNSALRSLLTNSDQFISTLVPQDHQLSNLIDSAGSVMDTTAQNQASLVQTLDDAPATLRSAQRFLAQLKQTTLPLGPAASDITQTAPRLTAALDQIPAFQRAAQPALTSAERVAPQLTRLAVGATPVITAAGPVARSVATFATDAKPLTYAAGQSIDNLLGLIEGWARSIQGRDGIGHVFHGRALIGPELINSLVNSLSTPTASNRRAQHAAKPNANPSPGTQPAATPTTTTPSSGTRAPLGGVVSGLGGAASGLTSTLGHLLGALHPSGANPGASSSTTTTPSSSGSGSGSLQHLLSYLLDR